MVGDEFVGFFTGYDYEVVDFRMYKNKYGHSVSDKNLLKKNTLIDRF